MYRDRKETRLQRPPNEIATEKRQAAHFSFRCAFFFLILFLSPLLSLFLSFFFLRYNFSILGDTRFRQFISRDGTKRSENRRASLFLSLFAVFATFLSHSRLCSCASDISLSSWLREKRAFLTREPHRRLDNCRRDTKLTMRGLPLVYIMVFTSRADHRRGQR